MLWTLLFWFYLCLKTEIANFMNNYVAIDAWEYFSPDPFKYHQICFLAWSLLVS